MSGKRVAVLGATGAVGQQMLKCLEERNFPISELIPLASAKSAGKTLTFKDEEIEIHEAKESEFAKADIVLAATGDEQAKHFVPLAAKTGAIVIDNSHAFRMDPEVPLVIPEINREAIFNHPKNIISNPNCATIIGLVPVWPLHKKVGLKRMIVSTYQAASGAGVLGLNELKREMDALSKGEDVGVTDPFAYQLALNLIPQIGSFGDNLYTSEEMKMQNEGRKISGIADLRVNCTCVRVPIMRSHSESITLEFEEPLSAAEARAILADAPGVKLVDEPENLRYPMPLEATDQDLILVGRIREDISAADGVSSLSLFCAGDQIRKGAATNAVQIAEALL